mmetsp:Transcript_16573/g.34615  ORF Transcript_16573/g.34615 Transcript_16573/m.34615 type:complete len:140 (-) Transcript_16573:416-835(-)
MAAFPRVGSHGRGCALLRVLLASTAAMLLGLVALLAGSPGAFLTPRSSGSALTGLAGQAPAVERQLAVAALVSEEAGTPVLVAQVDALRSESLEACMLATADDPASVERCWTLSHELSQAEQLLFKRQAAFRYVDNDSF